MAATCFFSSFYLAVAWLQAKEVLTMNHCGLVMGSRAQPGCVCSTECEG